MASINNKNTIKIIAPAKVNLFLAVGAAGSQKNVADGKHPVLNIMHTLVLHDVIYLEPIYGDGEAAKDFAAKSSSKINVEVEFLQSDDLDVELPEVKTKDNLVYKAITQLAVLCSQKSTRKKLVTIRAYIEKNIPSGAGLAGGSSDAAAALVGTSKIFGLEADDKRVLQVAQNLGSDVAFFLKGGCALYTGAGEIYDHKLAPINREIVIVKPMMSSLSTASVYKKFDELPDTHADLAKIEEATKQLQFADALPLFNNLAPAAESLVPELTDVRTWLADICKPENVLLCGSGACTFAFVPEDEDAEHIAHHARHQGNWATTTSLANVRARIIEEIE